MKKLKAIVVLTGVALTLSGCPKPADNNNAADVNATTNDAANAADAALNAADNSVNAAGNAVENASAAVDNATTNGERTDTGPRSNPGN